VRALDRVAARAADRVLVDTRAHAAYFARHLGAPPKRLAVVPMAVLPRPLLPLPPGPPYTVLYFGGFIPLHGLEHVLGAAERLADRRDIRFALVGDGQDLARTETTARQAGLARLTFHRGWWSEDDLVARHVAGAHICLGVFGSSAKAARVLPAKVLLALAAGRPTITRAAPGTHESLVHGQHAWLVPPADPAALAAAVARLCDDAPLRARLAAAGPALVAAKHSPAAVGSCLRDVLEEVCATPPDRR
jgi:glycosyltransferase involved in cell wall biosynthesis